jgi:hypothetical protein
VSKEPERAAEELNQPVRDRDAEAAAALRSWARLNAEFLLEELAR